VNRIPTTHTGSLPRTPKVVQLLLAEDKHPGARSGELKQAVREAVEYVVAKQVECGLNIINDGEQGRKDYTVHVMLSASRAMTARVLRRWVRATKNFPSSHSY